MAMLEVKNISISFGGLKAVDDFNITIEKGQLYGLIGPNGAGKTTIFNLLTGVYKPDCGRILLDGQDITGHKTAAINRAGIARTFQNIRLFKDLSVLDNVRASQPLPLFHAGRDLPPALLPEGGEGHGRAGHGAFKGV